MSKQCETCRKFRICWSPNPEPFLIMETGPAQYCIKNGYMNWELETREMSDRRHEFKIILFLFLLMACVIIGTIALL
jgi:hypothetical protein